MVESLSCCTDTTDHFPDMLTSFSPFKKHLTHIFTCVLLLAVSACGDAIKQGDALSQEDLKYIRSLGILEEGETILLFDSQGAFGGKRNSGNFITDKRVATYWIDEHDSQENLVESAFYPDIDTLLTKDMSQSATYASYLEVKTKDKRNFRVTVDGKEHELQQFFDLALAQWRKNRGTPAIAPVAADTLN